MANIDWRPTYFDGYTPSGRQAIVWQTQHDNQWHWQIVGDVYAHGIEHSREEAQAMAQIRLVERDGS